MSTLTTPESSQATAGILQTTDKDKVMDPLRFEKKIIKRTKEALDAGATVAEIAQALAPVIGRSRLYRWVEKWKKEGLM